MKKSSFQPPFKISFVFLTIESDAKNLAGCFALIESSLLKRPVEFNGAETSTRTFIYTTAAIPAFIGMQRNRGFALLGIWYIHVDLTDVYTRVAAVADLGISDYRPIRRSDIGKNVYFFPFISRALEDFPCSFKGNCGAGCCGCFQEIPAFYCRTLFFLFHSNDPFLNLSEFESFFPFYFQVGAPHLKFAASLASPLPL